MTHHNSQLSLTVQFMSQTTEIQAQKTSKLIVQ
jgi:hypothetical protein